MESSEPASIIGAIAAAASAITGIVSATSKPDVPDQPKAVPNQMAMNSDRKRVAIQTANASNVKTSQKLGNIGV
jgi:hypothetical protein